MKKKSHDRSPDKRNFSIALPIALIEKLQGIAADEARSRNRQIERFLESAVKQWAESQAAVVPRTDPLKANDPPAAAPQNSGSIGQRSPGPVKKPIRHNSRH